MPKTAAAKQTALVRLQTSMAQFAIDMAAYQAQQAEIQMHRLNVAVAAASKANAVRATPQEEVKVTYHEATSAIGHVLLNVEAKYVLAIIKHLSEEIKSNSKIEKLIEKMETTGLRQLWKALESLYSTDNDNGRVALDVIWSKVSVDTCEGDLLKFLKKLKEIIKRYQKLTVQGRKLTMDESLINMKLNSELTYDKSRAGFELREKTDDAEDAAGSTRSKGLVRVKIMIEKLKKVRERDEHRVDGQPAHKKKHSSGLNLIRGDKGKQFPEELYGSRQEEVNEHVGALRGGHAGRGRSSEPRGRGRGRGGSFKSGGYAREKAPLKLVPKTKTHCFHHLKEPGSCPFGEDCRYEHLDEHELYNETKTKEKLTKKEAFHPKFGKEIKQEGKRPPAERTENFCSFCGGKHPLKDCRAKLIDPKKAFAQSRGKERASELGSLNAANRRSKMLEADSAEEESEEDAQPRWARKKGNHKELNMMDAAFYMMAVQASLSEYSEEFGNDKAEWNAELQAHVAKLENDYNKRMLYDSGATMSFSGSSRGGYNFRDAKVTIKVGGGKVYLADRICTKMVPCIVHGKLLGFREIDFVIWDKCKGDIICTRDLAQGRNIVQDEFAFKVMLPNGVEQMHGYFDNDTGLYYLPGTEECAQEMMKRLSQRESELLTK